MIYQGKALTVALNEQNIAEMCIDLKGESVNKFNLATVAELSKALDALEAAPSVQGLLIHSTKDSLLVGADIVEFSQVFTAGPDKVAQHIKCNIDNFNRIEDLPFPVVIAINGYALGGGFELALACDYRVAAQSARVGLPETRLGIIPGWGGTVRLPRIAGVDAALEWIAGGKEHKASAALSIGAVDAVVDDQVLLLSAHKLMAAVVAGDHDYQVRRKAKTSPLGLNGTESLMAFETAKAFVGAQAGPYYPAPITAVKVVQKASTLNRDAALAVETEAFVRMALSPEAAALVNIFGGDQFLSKKAKKMATTLDKPIELGAVLGAGIMGGGIAYQSAVRGVPVVMKDIRESALALGLAEASKILAKRVDRGRIDTATMAQVLNAIDPTLGFDRFSSADVVIEAVVENSQVKASVLSEAETQISHDAVLASNTSTISIDLLSKGLKRPENFCGMHFFNPVHAMPLVEVIRGEQTSDNTIAKVVSYALAMGKKPVVVNDCPGFLVNRVLFPYFAGFSMLLRDGATYMAVDKIMERWGWPMGPAYLLDVVGMDTAVHLSLIHI